MGLFEFLVKLNHPEQKKGWIQTTATFTGEVSRAVSKSGRGGVRYEDYNAYRIRYYAGEKEQLAWFSFFPAPDPDPSDIAGTTLQIQYNKRRPYLFKEVRSLDESVDFDDWMEG